jgi:hypothetical protein
MALVLTAIGTLIASVGAVITGVITALRVERVHKTINSRMDEMLVLTRSEERTKGDAAAVTARAEGVVQGRNEK